MRREDSHLSDQCLLADIEGELPARDQAAVNSHLEACWACRTRRKEIEDAIGEYMRLHQREFEPELPPIEGPRALLKARIAQLAAAAPRADWFGPFQRKDWALAAAACVLVAGSLFIAHSVVTRRDVAAMGAAFSIPDSRLTPGAAVLANKQAVCSQANVNNKSVSAAMRQRVFDEYGISRAEPQAYEVDYLVTPALGGADDLRNLWPHSYAAVWNARVKDVLEERLRDMVCDGNLELTVAQKEIAGNWIAAYKKYFHTQQPLEERRP